MKLSDKKTISSHFICAIEYGDFTGLEEHEDALVEEFMKEFAGCFFQYSDRTHFATCYICNSKSDCVDVEIYK